MFVVSTWMNFWSGCLRPPLGRHVDHRSLENFEQGLLYALARHVARDRRVVALAGDLVDLVDEDDSRPAGYVVVGRLKQPREDTSTSSPHVARLGQYGRVDDRERNVQQLGDSPGHQRLARTGRTDHQDVRLVDLDLLFAALLVHQPLVVVVYGDGHVALGLVLPDNVLVQKALMSTGCASVPRAGSALTFLLSSAALLCSSSECPCSMHWSQMQAPSLPANRTPTSLRRYPQNEQQSASFRSSLFPHQDSLCGRFRAGPERSPLFAKTCCSVTSSCARRAPRRSGRTPWPREPSSSSLGRRPSRSSTA